MAKNTDDGSDKDVDPVNTEQATNNEATDTVVAEDEFTAQADNEATDAVFAEDEFTAQADTDSDKGSSRWPAVLAIIALIISALASTGFVYLASTGGGDEGRLDAADTRLAELAASVAQNQTSLSQLRGDLSGISNRSGTSGVEIAALEQRLESRLRSMDPVPGRLVRLERSFSTLQGISTGVQDTWLLAETEYYMQIANAQLQLAGNPHLATLALKLADERLLQLANPALTDVRRVLLNELQTLAVTEKPDIEGAALTLASLAGLVDSLPLRQEVRATLAENKTPDPELSGVDRAIASLKGAVGNVVTVRRSDEAIRPLMAPEAIYFLRANLALQLQAARLSLLRGEQAVFQQSLDDATAWIGEYYDKESTPVRSALQTLRELRDSSFVSALPDISESLRLLRQHVTFTQSTVDETALGEPPTDELSTDDEVTDYEATDDGTTDDEATDDETNRETIKAPETTTDAEPGQ